MEYKICLYLISTNIFSWSTKDKRNMKYFEFCSNNKKDKKGSTVYAMFQFLKQMITEAFFTKLQMLHISLNNDIIYLKTTSTVPLYNNKIKNIFARCNLSNIWANIPIFHKIKPKCSPKITAVYS